RRPADALHGVSRRRAAGHLHAASRRPGDGDGAEARQGGEVSERSKSGRREGLTPPPTFGFPAPAAFPESEMSINSVNILLPRGRIAAANTSSGTSCFATIVYSQLAASDAATGWPALGLALPNRREGALVFRHLLEYDFTMSIILVDIHGRERNKGFRN